MADAQTILVIFLSTTLAILLVLAIILLVFLINIVQRVKRITAKAEEVVDKAETAAEFFKQASVPVAVTRIIKTLADLLNKRSSKTKEEE